PDGEASQDAAHHEDRERPPHRLGGETEPMRQVREDLLLQVADECQEAVGGRRDWHAQDRGKDQQLPGTAAGQQSCGGLHGRGGLTGWAGPARWTRADQAYPAPSAPDGLLPLPPSHLRVTAVSAAHLRRVRSAGPGRKFHVRTNHSPVATGATWGDTQQLTG